MVPSDEGVDGEKCAHGALLLKPEEGTVAENQFPNTSRQTPQAQGVLGPLEPPKPHVRGGALVLQTIELVAEASHDAPHFLLMDGKASLVQGVAGIGEFVIYRSFADAEDTQVVYEHEVFGTRGSCLPVSSG